MYFKKSFFLILQFFILAGSFSQTTIDSLRSVFYSSETEIESRINTSAAIAQYYLYSNPDSAKYYAEMGLDLSRKNNNTRGIFKHACILGNIFMGGENLVRAVSILESAVAHLDELEDERTALCVFLLLGYAYDMQENYYAAHKAYFKGLDIAEKKKDTVFLYSYYNNLGNHFYGLDEYQKGLEMFRKSLFVYSKLRPEQIRFPLASVYSNIGSIYKDINQLDSAKLYLKKALSMPGVMDNYYGRNIVNQNLGEVALLKGQYDSALVYFEKAGIALDSLVGNFNGTMAPLYAVYYNNLGELYFRLNQPVKARSFSLKAIESSELLSELSERAEAYQRLARIYESEGNYPLALDYQKKYTVSRDSLLQRKADKEITSITLAFEYEKELEQSKLQMEMMDLRHQRKENLYIFAFVTAGGIIISLFLLFFLQRTKARKKTLEEKNARLEKEKVTEELEYKNKELATNVLYLLKKNELIATIAKRLKDVTEDLSEKHTNKLNNIISELNSGSSRDIWEEFEIRFKEVHTDFYNRLSKEFSDLSPQEYRLCAFLRLNMTNKEIAAITYQSIDSLRTARYRLRKKLGLGREENLVTFLAKI